jgi:hypothetical protein
MQVTHINESDSFVAIGGEKAAKFQVAASAAAFKIMSDTLYRDKERATVREVICNAVDANIEAGLPDEPVDVTLTEDEMIVADSGNGIPHEKIVEIYCTLFGSQKAKDKRVTGGFGLGCKAPFSITDHFTVESNHAGTKSLYAMVASDPEEDDCPSAKRMMKVPTDARGLKVSIPLAPGMHSKIERCIKEIVREGGMNVRLNGATLEAPDFTGLKEVGYGVFGSIANQSSNRLRLLYANVIYPIDSNPSLHLRMERIKELVGRGSAPIVFYAQPSTIGVTPSRESLSYDEITVEVIGKLLDNAIREIEAAMPGKRDIALGELMDKLTRDTLHLHRDKRNLVWTSGQDFVGPDAIAMDRARFWVREGQYSRRDFVLKAVQRFSDSRRSLKNLLPQCNSYSYSVRGGDALTNDLIAERYFRLRKRIVRVAGPLAGLLLTRDHSSARLKGIKSPDAYPFYHHRLFEPRITLAPTQKLISDNMNDGFAISTARLPPAEIDALKARAAHYKVKVDEVAAPPKVKREKKEAPRFYGPETPEFPLLFGISGHTPRRFIPADGPCHDVRTLNRSQKFFTPDAVFTARGTTNDSQPALVIHDTMHEALRANLARKLIGRVAVATKRERFEWYEAQGVRRIEEIILEKLRARTKRPKPYEAFYARMAVRALDGSDDGRRTGFSSKMMRTSRRIAHAAVREPYKQSADRDQAYELWMLARLVFHQRHVRGQHMDADEQALIQRYYEEYRELAMPLEARTFGSERWWLRTDHLELLANLNVNPSGLAGDQLDDFIHLTEELAKRHAARSKETSR